MYLAEGKQHFNKKKSRDIIAYTNTVGFGKFHVHVIHVSQYHYENGGD